MNYKRLKIGDKTMDYENVTIIIQLTMTELEIDMALDYAG